MIGHLKHPHIKIVVGTTLFIIGIILAPSGTPEDLITTVPLIAIFGLQTYTLIAMVGYICIIAGILLVGHGILARLGPAKVFFKHPIVLLGVVIIVGFIIWRSLG